MILSDLGGREPVNVRGRLEYSPDPDKLDSMAIPVRIVLVATSHPGNIGASARAMKTMGLSELALVAPKAFPSEEATARASGADDVLRAARVFRTLAEAVADCSFVVGASARLRSVAVPTLDPRAAADAVWERLPVDRVALVFGPEQSGLTNDDLARCQVLAHIPSNPEYGSLNLAMAVQVFCYELNMQRRRRQGAILETHEVGPRASSADMERFFEHLEQVLVAGEFLNAAHPQQLKLKLRRIFQRAAPDQNELNILRGVLSALDPARARARRATDSDDARR